MARKKIKKLKAPKIRTAYRAFDRVQRAAWRDDDTYTSDDDQITRLAAVLRSDHLQLATALRNDRVFGAWDQAANIARQLGLPASVASNPKSPRPGQGIDRYTAHVEYSSGECGDISTSAHNRTEALQRMRRYVKKHDQNAWVDPKSVQPGDLPRRY